MPEYYFDIETYSPEKKPNPDKDKIITIQVQQIDIKTGKPKSKLEILKEWESSEKDIVITFYNKFKNSFEEIDVWQFVPVGYSLSYDFEFLISKFRSYIGKEFTSRFYYNRPYLDLKHVIVLLNGEFKGASLDKSTSKKFSGAKIKEWYENKKFGEIELYIKNEAESFLELLQKARRNIRKVL
jgi:hypothetical protein